jgi:hypothetical protein
MSDFTIEIVDTKYTIEIETSIANTLNNINIETTTDKILEISAGYTGTVVYASDVIGLDNYLANFIDLYEIDCGTP